MKSLIIISNRLPFVVSSNDKRINSAGGLVTALAPLVVKSNGYWIGWAGKDFNPNGNGSENDGATATIPESDDPTSISHEIKSSQIVPVVCEEEVYDNFYNGMCNGSLWPILHSLPSHSVFNLDYWNAYVQINEQFAALALETLKKVKQSLELDTKSGISPRTDSPSTANDKIVWIHDYQLLVLPMMLKNLTEEAHISCKIAFFMHIPFPSSDVFRLIPWAKEILLGLLGCDLIAFHTITYASNFLDCCFSILGTRIDKSELIIEYGNKIIVVKALPIGIPYDWFEEQAKTSPKQLCFVKEKVILGVDRLDYTKGIIQRVHGYERFLEKYPEYREKVVLIQIAVPSRTDVDEYRHLKDELEREVGRISGRFCTSDWTPIKYIYKSLSQHELTGYYRDSAIALITPIRDGMNLVAKEYVACQVSDPGVLIISPFTGAGETMLEALSVNPLEKDMLADCIKKALDMSYYERNLRMNALKTRERLFNVDTWIDSFFEACESINCNDFAFNALNINDIESWLGPIVTGYKLTLILDYDGTLVPLKSHPDLAILSEDVKRYLEELISFPEIDVCLLSGRSLANLKKMVQIKNISLAGSHAMELELGSEEQIIDCDQALPFKGKIPDLVKDLEEHVCQHGGWVEAKVYHVAFHWRETEINYREAMKKRSKEIIEKHGFQYQEGHFVAEARPPIGWDKGRGAFHILEKIHGYTWADNVRVIYIGDDNTDEDAMRALSGLGTSFRVGKPNIKTNATHRLPDTESVKVFLQWAVEYMNQRKKYAAKTKRRNQGIIKREPKYY